MKSVISIIVLLSVTLLTPTVKAEGALTIPISKIDHPGAVDFGKEVLPILRRNCLACHNAQSAKAKLVLETPQTIAKGGANGPVVQPGKADESMLLMVASHESKPFMPPADNDRRAVPLTSNELGLLKLWINQGATGEVAADKTVKWQPLPPGMNAVYAAAISPDGRYAAAARANQIFVYNVPGKRELGRLTDPALLQSGLYKKPGIADLDVINALAFSADGQLLVSGGFRDVKLWRRSSNVHRADWTGLESPPRSLAVSPDGATAATGEENGKIRLWQVATGQTQVVLEGHTAAVTGLHFSADGARLLSGSQDKSLRVWDIASHKPTGMLITPATVNAVGFVNDDKQVATGGGDNLIRFWEIPTTVEPATEPPKPIHELKGHGSPIQSLESAKTAGTDIFSVSQDSTVRRWNSANGSELGSINVNGTITSLAMAKVGKPGVAVTANGFVKMWDPANGQEFPEVRTDVRNQIKLDVEESALELARRRVENAKNDLTEAQAELKREQDNIPKVTAARDQAQTELKQKTEAAVQPLAAKEMADKEFEAAKPALAAAEEARKSAETGDDNTKNAANQALQQAQQKLQQAKDRVNQTTDPARRALGERTAAERNVKQLTGALEQTAATLKKATDAIPLVEAALRQEEELHKQRQALVEPARQLAGQPFKPFRAVAISDDGRLAAVGSDDGVVYTFSTIDGTLVETYEAHKAPVTALAFTRDGDVISTAADQSIIVWDVDPEWKLERKIGSPESSDFVDRVTAVAFSPDGSLVATGGGEPSRSGEVKLWNTSTGALVHNIVDAHSDTVLGMEFSPDGKQLATASADRFVKLFDVATGKHVRSFEGHTHHVTGVSWRADGRLLASSGAEGVVKIWNLKTGEQRNSIREWGREATSVQFLGVEDKIVASSADAGVRMKRTDGGQERGFGDGAVYYYVTRSTANGRQMLAAGHDGKLSVSHMQENNLVAEFPAP